MNPVFTHTRLVSAAGLGQSVAYSTADALADLDYHVPIFGVPIGMVKGQWIPGVMTERDRVSEFLKISVLPQLDEFAAKAPRYLQRDATTFPEYTGARNWVHELATWVRKVNDMGILRQPWATSDDEWRDLLAKNRALESELRSYVATLRKLLDAAGAPRTSLGRAGPPLGDDGGLAATGASTLTLLAVGLMGWGAYKKDTGTITSGALLFGASLLAKSLTGPSFLERKAKEYGL